MKIYTVIIIQMMIWSGFTLMEWLSKNDQPIYNILMFLVFLYLAILISNYFIQSARKTILVTMISLIIYSSLHLTLSFIQV